MFLYTFFPLSNRLYTFTHTQYMRIFTQSIGFLTNDEHRSPVVSFLTCLRYIFNSSVIPEILSNHDQDLLSQLVIKRKNRERRVWYRLFLQSHTMQFSPTLIDGDLEGKSIALSSLSAPSYGDGDDDDKDYFSEAFVKEIVLPLKKNMRYFSCTLQRCEVNNRDLRGDKDGLLAILADVRSLTHLEFHLCWLNVNEFLSLFLASSSRNQLEYLSISIGNCMPSEEKDDDDLPPGIEGQSFQRLRHLTTEYADYTIAVKLLRHCPNLRSVDFQGLWKEPQELATFCPKLSSLQLRGLGCEASRVKELIFNLPQLTNINLRIPSIEDTCLDAPWLPDQLPVLKLDPFKGIEAFNFSHIGQLRSLTVLHLSNFDKCLKDKDMHHFSNLVSLRDLHIADSKITSNGLVEITKNSSTPGSFLPQLVSLSLERCELGGKAKSPQNLITFFSFCSTNLKKVSLHESKITNDDLSAELVAHWKRCGIESLNVGANKKLDDNKKSGLVNLKQLTSLTELDISHLDKATHFDFISSMQQLKTLNALCMVKLKATALAVFSQTRDSFLHLRTLNLLCCCQKQQRSGRVDKVFELLLKNDSIKYRLTGLEVGQIPEPERFFDVTEEMEKFHVAKKLPVTW